MPPKGVSVEVARENVVRINISGSSSLWRAAPQVLKTWSRRCREIGCRYDGSCTGINLRIEDVLTEERVRRMRGSESRRTGKKCNERYPQKEATKIICRWTLLPMKEHVSYRWWGRGYIAVPAWSILSDRLRPSREGSYDLCMEVLKNVSNGARRAVLTLWHMPRLASSQRVTLWLLSIRLENIILQGY